MHSIRVFFKVFNGNQNVIEIDITYLSRVGIQLATTIRHLCSLATSPKQLRDFLSGHAVSQKFPIFRH